MRLRTLYRPTLSAAWAEARVRLLHASRYPGQLALETLLPIVLAAMPMLLGRAVAGQDAATHFAAHTGTTNYVAYLLLGSNVFILVSRAFWDIAYWLRYEQETGTLEGLGVTPTSLLTLAGGVSLYSAIRGLCAGTLAYFVGCLVFKTNPFSGNVLLAFGFLLVGLIPLYATALLCGALVLRVKESNRLVTLMQWGGSFLMGVYFPVSVLPPFARGLALAFPPTWMTNGARAAMLGTGFFFDMWYADLAVLWGFLLFLPLVSARAFQAMERRIRRTQGLGEY